LLPWFTIVVALEAAKETIVVYHNSDRAWTIVCASTAIVCVREGAWGKMYGVDDRPRSGRLDGLNADDPGVAMLGSALRGVPAREVLLICTGEVPGVGADATRLILDVREREGAGPRRVPIEPDVPGPEMPDLRVCAMWPRAHLGKDFSQQCAARAALLLPSRGRLLCAVRKQKGADSQARAMEALFGNVRVLERDRGYRLLRSERGAAVDEAMAWELVRRRYRIEDPLLEGSVLQAAPGVFSRRELDAGTRCLIEFAARSSVQPSAVLDLCCGVGPLALWAAKRWPSATVTAVDSNLVAVALARENADANAVRVKVLEHDGLPVEGGPVDLTLCNPPTHADAETLVALFAPLPAWHRRGSHFLAVATRPAPIASALRPTGAEITIHARERYAIVQAEF
jgi:16S rRNA G1207 methylase RsmC